MSFTPHRTDIQVRFADSDALGHINNASFATYVEVARLQFFATFGTSLRSMILANLQIDYRRQVKLEDRVHVDTWVERLGTSSISLSHTVYAENEPAAEVRSVVVYFDYVANRSQPLSDAMRATLDGFVRR